MRVLFITSSGAEGPSLRHRVQQYIEPLESEGFQCTVLRSRELPLWRIGQLRTYHAVVVHKRLMPVLWTVLASRVTPNLVYDVDDAVWANPGLDWDAVTRLRTATRLKMLLSRSKCVTVGNEYLAEYARRFNPDVRIFPTCIDTEHYRPENRLACRQVRIGWIGSSANLRYLNLLEAVFSRLAHFDELTLAVMCDRGYCSPHLPTEFTPWSSEGEVRFIQSLDIGIMPLTDDEWTRGKCGFKILQYMACGVPSVSSKVGFNKGLVDEGRNGYLAEDEHEWVEKLTLLINSPGLRGSIGASGRRTIDEHYSKQAGIDRLTALFRGLELREQQADQEAPCRDSVAGAIEDHDPETCDSR